MTVANQQIKDLIDHITGLCNPANTTRDGLLNIHPLMELGDYPHYTEQKKINLSKEWAPWTPV